MLITYSKMGGNILSILLSKIFGRNHPSSTPTRPSQSQKYGAVRFENQSSMTSAKLLKHDELTEHNDDRDDGTSNSDSRTIDMLGLKRCYEDDYSRLSKAERDLLNIENWTLIFIERNYDAIKDKGLKRKLSKELLIEIGFEGNSDAVKTILSRSKLFLPSHISPIDSVKRFVVDEIKYWSAPSDLESLLKLKKTYPDTREQGKTFSDYAIFVDSAINTIKGIILEETTKSRYIKTQIDMLRLRDGEVFFHGTDIDSALDIFSGGIAVSKGSQKRDFSHGKGFYLMDDFESAKSYAFSITRRPVVLVFLFPRSCREKSNILTLFGASKENEWKEFVRANRLGTLDREKRKKLQKFDCIEGPVAEMCETESEMIPRQPLPNSRQLCIINENFADEISKYLKKVVIYNIIH